MKRGTKKGSKLGSYSAERKKKISEALKLSYARRGKVTFSLEHRQRISASLKGKSKSPISDETRQKMSKAGKGRKQSPEHIEKRAAALRGIAKPAQSERNKGNSYGTVNKGKSKPTWTAEHKKNHHEALLGKGKGKRPKMSVSLRSQYANGREPSNGRCKWYLVNGIKCQGTLERKYIRSLIEVGARLPSRGPRIETEFGFYFTDFEFEDRYIEIKCEYTFQQSLKSGQMKKINWVRDYVKPVQIIII